MVYDDEKNTRQERFIEKVLHLARQTVKGR